MFPVTTGSAYRRGQRPRWQPWRSARSQPPSLPKPRPWNPPCRFARHNVAHARQGNFRFYSSLTGFAAAKGRPAAVSHIRRC
jgi:hypothetical protein